MIFLDAAAGRDNPSAIHAEGVAAKKRFALARAKIAAAIGASPDEIVCTSGGTEGNNAALAQACGQHVVISAFEHPSVKEPAIRLPHAIAEDVRAAVSAIRPTTRLVSFTVASSESGTVFPIREIACALRRLPSPRPLFHTDACQAPGLLPIGVRSWGVDLATFNSAKFGGPRGAGFLFVKRGTSFAPFFLGGGQERGMRAGTESVSLIEDMAAALARAEKRRPRVAPALARMRDWFIGEVVGLPGVTLEGHPVERLPNHAAFFFSGIDPEWLVLQLDAAGVAASVGSACSLKSGILSPVRFTFSPRTTIRELKITCRILTNLIRPKSSSSSSS